VGWTLNETTLRDFIENKLSPRLEVKGSDAQVKVVGKSVRLEPAVTGVMIDRVALAQTLEQTLGQLSPTPVLISLVTQEPRVSNEAALQAQNIITTTIIKPLTLKAGFNTFTMSENDLWDMVQAVPDSQGKLTASLDETKLRIFLQGLASTVNQELQNPVLVIKNNRAVTFVPPQNEVRLLINESVQKIEAAATSDQREVELITSEKAPSGDLASTNNLGINALVARGTSNFAGSPPNRRHNIKVGLARFDGIIVAPGETFSFDQALGPVNASAGYLPELVIKGDSTVPEFGGGLCQISTTAFRAILNGGYPVKERVNHSYRVVYYEPAGSDATIYPPNPDLKFTNDTPGAILMHTYQKGDNAYFDFYGTSMPRKVVLDGPHILKTTGYPAPVYVETSSLAPGVIKQIDRAHQGADTILTQYVYDEQGGLIRKQEFKSHYIPWPSKFLVGAAAAPKVETDLKQTPPPLEQTEGLTTGTSTS
jgi:vancomycin resistance protein YoaR